MLKSIYKGRLHIEDALWKCVLRSDLWEVTECAGQIVLKPGHSYRWAVTSRPHVRIWAWTRVGSTVLLSETFHRELRCAAPGEVGTVAAEGAAARLLVHETWNKPSAFLGDNETPASVSYSCMQAYICLKSNWMMSAEAALNAGHCCSSLTCLVFMALWLPDLTVLAVSLQRHGSDEEAGMWWHQDQLPWRAASPAGVGQTGNPHQPGVCAGLSGTSWIRTHTLSSHSS